MFTYQLIPTPPGDWENSIYDMQAIRMAAIHNLMIRAFNSIIYHAPKIGKKDLPSFLKYCSALVETVHEHHTTEEEIIFPALEEKLGKGSMESNVNQHHDFMPKFDLWSDLIKSISVGKTEYNAEEFVSSMKDATDVLVIHLRDEIPSLESTRLQQHLTVAELEALEIKAGERIREVTSFWNMPLFFANGDLAYNSWLPAIPGHILFMIRYIIVPLSGGTWKYGQSDKYGRLKDEFKAGYGLD
ncbi:Hemerythrin HHE cation binding domain [Ceratobasidium sp. AG-Ba]|nr:Hemerythrin HHE cation binding domain [Ceratobasidium sp. AG-Ba]